MRKSIPASLTALVFLFLLHPTYCQNIGMGTTSPANKLEVVGNFLVNAPTSGSTTAPTPAQTQTMSNGSTINYATTDSVGRIYDPGGPVGNYINNLNAIVILPQQINSPGYEINLEDVELLGGDSVIISDGPGLITFLSIGNGFSTPGRYVFNSYALRITFKSNADGINGRGFSILFRRLYLNTANQQSVGGAIGTSFFFDTKNGVLRAGRMANETPGYFSTGFGVNPEATGIYSFASGFGSKARGELSTAMGAFNTANGNRSFAIGSGNTAGAEAAVAMGANTTASGGASFAMGVNSIASGEGGTALGLSTTASGLYSTATGENTVALGRGSVAMGNAAYANGTNSFASGTSTTANNANSVAMGEGSISSGGNSLAMGTFSNANGYASVAMGYNAFTATGASFSTALGLSAQAIGVGSLATGSYTQASGSYSTAMGNYVSTSNFNGAFAIGDNSTTTVMQSFVDNGFRSRFAGGYRLLTNAAANVGVVLGANGNAWSAISDVKLKENFIPVKGESFLNNIAKMPLTTWNYVGQDARIYRHYGPMAQDFYNAFGKDELGQIGCDTLINQQDFLGVNLIAIQALENRTTVLSKENETLKNEVDKLKARIEKLEMLLVKP